MWDLKKDLCLILPCSILIGMLLAHFRISSLILSKSVIVAPRATGICGSDVHYMLHGNISKAQTPLYGERTDAIASRKDR